jgi:hypothetical protein
MAFGKSKASIVLHIYKYTRLQLTPPHRSWRSVMKSIGAGTIDAVFNEIPDSVMELVPHYPSVVFIPAQRELSWHLQSTVRMIQGGVLFLVHTYLGT